MTGLRGLTRIGALALVVSASNSIPSAAAAQRSDPDFLFERPFMSFTIRGGVALPEAGSEIFDFTSEQLTVGPNAYNSVAFGAEMSFRVSGRFDVALGVGISQSSTLSEFRDFVDFDDLPIEQTTKFTRVPTTLSAKYYLIDRGRSIGRFAWVPAAVAPYVGGGGGVIWYQFEQRGDWVDFDTLDIFTDTFESQGSTGVGHLLAGVDLSLGPRWYINGEGRYSFASARMESDFIGFDDIDLGGFEATLGFAIRF